MRLECEPKDFLSAVEFAAKACDFRSGITVLSHVRLTAADGRLTVEGADLNLHAKATATAAVPEGGAACVSARALSAFAATCKGLVSVSGDDHTVTISSGLSSAKLPAIGASQFPSPKIDKTAEVEIDKTALRLAALCDMNHTDARRHGVTFTDGYAIGAGASFVGITPATGDGVIPADKAAMAMSLDRLFLSPEYWRAEGENRHLSGRTLAEKVQKEFAEKTVEAMPIEVGMIDADEWLDAATVARVPTLESREVTGSGVLCSIADGKMNLSAQGSYGSAESQIRVDGDDECTFAVSFVLLQKILSLAKGSVVSVSRGKECIKLKSGADTFMLFTMKHAKATF